MKHLAALPLLATVSGCATIVSDASYPVAFSSDPPGAEATIRDENARLVHQDRTPFELTLDAHDGYFDAMQYAVHFEKACFDPVDVHLDATLDEWYWGNLALGGAIGMLLLDPGTGSMWKIDERVEVVLAPSPGCESGADAAQAPGASPPRLQAER